MVIRIKLRQLLDDLAFREQRHITLRELARRSGITPATLARIATVPGYNATLRNIDALCTALSCSPGELLEHVDVTPLPNAKPDRVGAAGHRTRQEPRKRGTQATSDA